MDDWKTGLANKLGSKSGPLKWDIANGKGSLELSIDQYHMLIRGLDCHMQELRKETEPNPYWNEVADLMDILCMSPIIRNWTIKSKQP